jgi:hypothetical protein
MLGTSGKDAIGAEEEDDDDDGGGGAAESGTATPSSSPPRVRTRTCMTTGPGQNFDARRRNASRLSLKLAACSLRPVPLGVPAGASDGDVVGLPPGASGPRRVGVAGREGGSPSAPRASIVAPREPAMGVDGDVGVGAAMPTPSGAPGDRAGGGGRMAKVLGLVKWQKPSAWWPSRTNRRGAAPAPAAAAGQTPTMHSIIQSREALGGWTNPPPGHPPPRWAACSSWGWPSFPLDDEQEELREAWESEDSMRTDLEDTVLTQHASM